MLKNGLCAVLVFFLMGMFSGDALSALAACRTACGADCCGRDVPPGFGIHGRDASVACCRPSGASCHRKAEIPEEPLGILFPDPDRNFFKTGWVRYDSIGLFSLIKTLFSRTEYPLRKAGTNPVPVYLETRSLLI